MEPLIPSRWLLSVLAAIGIAGFLAVTFHLLPEQAMPKDRSPWWLGVAPMFFTVVAILAWVKHSRPTPARPSGSTRCTRNACARLPTGSGSLLPHKWQASKSVIA